MHLFYKKEENGRDQSLFIPYRIDFLLISVQIVSKMYPVDAPVLFSRNLNSRYLEPRRQYNGIFLTFG